MRAIIDLLTHQTASPLIVQVEPTPSPGVASATSINGKYLIPIVKCAEFAIDSNSYVLNAGVLDGGDISSISYAYLLAMYSQMGCVYFNPLLTADHVAEFDFAGTFIDGPDTFYVRMQTGQDLGPTIGQMPTHTAMLPINSAVVPSRPGMIITKKIDLALYIPLGTDQFLVYWKLYDFSVTHDVSFLGLGPGPVVNEPAIRSVYEVDQEPLDLQVYISPDGGASWTETGMLELVTFNATTTEIWLAFRNNGTTKLYLATYGVLF